VEISILLRSLKINKSIRTVLIVIFVLALVAVTGLVALSTFGGKKMSESNATVMPVVSAVAGQAPTISKPEGTPPSELTFSDVIVGTGAEVLPTSTLTVHYTLMAWSTGKIIESSWSGEPATFPLAQVVEGWQKGLPGAKVGGRRLLILPPSMGYGVSGAGPIGPNETLIFSVDIIGVS
jgi:FKBP-type peptidyl-prolyl cis-trans isomerase